MDYAQRRPAARPRAVDESRSLRRTRAAGVIVVDSSALIAILRREPEAGRISPRFAAVVLASLQRSQCENSNVDVKPLVLRQSLE
jgi:hypothetical protein